MQHGEASEAEEQRSRPDEESSETGLLDEQTRGRRGEQALAGALTLLLLVLLAYSSEDGKRTGLLLLAVPGALCVMGVVRSIQAHAQGHGPA